MADKALQPIEQKQVDFYGDELTAVKAKDGHVYVANLLKIQFSRGHFWHEKIQGMLKMAFCKTVKCGRKDSRRN